jgi:hypothetical protein
MAAADVTMVSGAGGMKISPRAGKPAEDAILVNVPRHLAGERILTLLTQAPGNGASIGGLKVVAENA